MNNNPIPHLAITLGDPAGIGPEIVLKALADLKYHYICDITVIGSFDILKQTYQQLQQHSHVTEAFINPQELSIIHVPSKETIMVGNPSVASGAASYLYLKKAIALTLQGKFDGIVTAPIAKSWWQAAGYNYPGQTEVLAMKAGVEKFGMLFVAKSPYTGWNLRTLLATTHIPLSQVPQALTPELMSEKLELLIHCLKQDFGISKPHIVISGLNPHSGEDGKIGTEEKDCLMFWLQQQRNLYPHIRLSGLIPPDTLWIEPAKAWYHEKLDLADAYIALYHDQGLIPVKLMAFEQAVNTTIGLPFIRTSPDHGTAFNIAGQGIAKAASIKSAIDLAIDLTRGKMNRTI